MRNITITSKTYAYVIIRNISLTYGEVGILDADNLEVSELKSVRNLRLEGSILLSDSDYDYVVSQINTSVGGGTGGGGTGSSIPNVIDYDPTLAANQSSGGSSPIPIIIDPTPRPNYSIVGLTTQITPTISSGDATVGTLSTVFTTASGEFSCIKAVVADGESITFTIDKDELYYLYITGDTLAGETDIIAYIGRSNTVDCQIMYPNPAKNNFISHVELLNGNDVTVKLEHFGLRYKIYVNGVEIGTTNEYPASNNLFVMMQQADDSVAETLSYGFDVSDTSGGSGIINILPSNVNDGDYLKALSACTLLGVGMGTGDIIQLYDNKTKAILHEQVEDLTNYYTKAETDTALATKANTSDLSDVAMNGSYWELSDIPTEISAFNNDAGYLTSHQDISGKVDVVVGKGLSTNDYDATDKAKVNAIVTNGDGLSYFANDGTYKAVSGGGGGGGLDVTAVQAEIAKVIRVNNNDTPPSTSGTYAVLAGSASQGNSYTVSLGYYARALQNYAIAIGISSYAASSCAVAIGSNAIADGTDAVALGCYSQARGQYATSIGRYARIYSGYDNCTALGYYAEVTGSNQNQIGTTGTTTYCYGAVQDRSDIRDKTNIQDCELGLDFINALRPVKYQWDYRDDYARALFPHLTREDYEDDEAYEAALVQQQQDREAFFVNPVKDGSKAGSRYHHGLIAQEFKATLDSLGIDHAAYQDHSVKGGMDVKSIGYAELIPNLIKAIQELTARVEQLENQA